MITIKIFLISSGAAPAIVDQGQSDYACKFDEGYAQRFIKHLKNDEGLCTACGESCIDCRLGLVADYSDAVAGHLKLPLLTDQFIDDPEEYLQAEFPSHDITIAINIHSDLLIEVPDYASRAGSKALIVPVEDPDWLGGWVNDKVEEKCIGLGLEYTAPKPFCDLTGEEFVYVKEFVEEFRVGRPKVNLIRKNDAIERVDVHVSAPCGATYYLARLLEGQPANNHILEVACKGLSSYPCTASTKIDPDFKDSITHRANYIMMDILKECLSSSL